MTLSTPTIGAQLAKGREVPLFSLALFGWALVGLLLAAALLLGGVISLVPRLGLSSERTLALVAPVALLISMIGGFIGAAHVRKIGILEVLAASALYCLGAALLANAQLNVPYGLVRPELQEVGYLASLLGNPVSGAVIAALALSGAALIGGSLGYLLAGSGRIDLRFAYEAFIARSHLRLRRRSATRLMTIISICGVAVGVMALTVVMSVMSGFESDLKNKIIGANAHAMVQHYGTSFTEWREAAEKARGVRGVTGVSPFVLSEVMLTSDQNVSGALIKGIELATAGEVSSLFENTSEGKLEWLERPGEIVGAPFTKVVPIDPNEAPLPAIALGKELAHSLRVTIGERINVVSPLGGELGPTGPTPKSRPFRVAALIVTGMYEYDAKFAYISLAEAQSFFGLEESVTGLELKTDDLDNARNISRAVLAALDGYPYRTRDWGEMNKPLFSALRLEKVAMAIILAFIILVACFNIVSTLFMMVLEKSKEIAILKSMGATNSSVMKVFVLEGLAIGVIGTIVGLLLGLGVCLIIAHGVIRLDAEIYYIDRLPVEIEAVEFALAGFGALLLSYLATIYPATRASRLPPVEGLRSE